MIHDYDRQSLNGDKAHHQGRIADDLARVRFGEQRNPAIGAEPFERLGQCAFILKLAGYECMTDRLLSEINSIRTIRRTFDRGMSLAHEGAAGGGAFIVDEGWTFSSKLLPQGARQVLDIQIPGDIAGLQSLAAPFAVHNVTAITRVEAREIRFGALAETFVRCPNVARLFFRLATAETGIAGERLIDIGRRTALERTAHFILELATRLRLVGMGMESGFYCPMTQCLIADALGLTPIHVNRVLRDLRRARLAHHHRGWISLLDAPKLADLAQFNSAYLTQFH